MKLMQMLKRDGRLFLRGLLPAIILTALLALACTFAGYSAISGSHQETSPVRVALVDNEDSVLSRISINMVTGQDYVSSLLKIELNNEKAAMDGLSEGRYGAVVILPDKYMDSIMHGTNCKGTIYLSDALQNEGEVIRAIADFGERLLTAGQYGVFAGERIIADGGISTDVHTDFLEDSNTGLISFVLNAYGSLFTFETLSYSDTGVSQLFFYLACWITLIIFVCGLFFPDLYIADCKGSIYARLRTRGIGRFHFMFGKVLYPFLFRSMLALPIIKFFGIKSYIVIMAACFSVTIMTSCISVAMAKRGGWVVAILGFSSAFLFMSGGCLPRTMLPEVLTEISAYSPFGCINSLVLHSFGGSLNVTGIALCIFYSVLAVIWCMISLKNLDTHSEEVRL